MTGGELLSQDEIDALLRGAAEEESQFGTDGTYQIGDFLSNLEQDALGEIGNISFGSSATALSALLNQKVEITTPSVSVITQSKLPEEFPQPYVAIQVSYTEGFSGTNLLVIKQTDAAIIADLMLGGNGESSSELGEIQLSAVQEAMNQMMGSAATSMSTVFNKKVDISPPSIDILDVPQGAGTDKIPNEETLIRISFRLKIGELIDSNIMQLLPLQFAKELVQELLNPEAITAKTPINNENEAAFPQMSNQLEDLFKKEPLLEQMEQNNNHVESSRIQNDITSQQGSYSHQQYQMPSDYQSHQNRSQHLGASNHEEARPNVQPAVFSEFEPFQLQEAETKNLNMLLDIPLQVTVELGKTKRSVKEILEVSAGSIIELDKLAGEPVDILINNRLIAQGEVVVIEENFGVRVTDILSQTDRIKKLR